MCYQGLRQNFYSRAVVLKQALYIFYTEFIFTASYFLRRNEEKCLISRFFLGELMRKGEAFKIVGDLRSFEEAYEP